MWRCHRVLLQLYKTCAIKQLSQNQKNAIEHHGISRSWDASGSWSACLSRRRAEGADVTMLAKCRRSAHNVERFCPPRHNRSAPPQAKALTICFLQQIENKSHTGALTLPHLLITVPEPTTAQSPSTSDRQTCPSSHRCPSSSCPHTSTPPPRPAPPRPSRR